MPHLVVSVCSLKANIAAIILAKQQTKKLQHTVILLLYKPRHTYFMLTEVSCNRFMKAAIRRVVMCLALL
jgi:hypothetical protein